MSRKLILEQLKDKTKTPMSIIKANASTIRSVDKELSVVIMERLREDAQVFIKEYFDIIEDPEYSNKPRNLFMIDFFDKLREMQDTITYYGVGPLKNKLESTDWMSKIENYGVNHNKIQKLMDKGIYLNNDEDTLSFVFYDSKGRLGFSCPQLSVRQIVLKMGILENDPWFYLILAHNMTRGFQEQAETYYAFDFLLDALKG